MTVSNNYGSSTITLSGAGIETKSQTISFLGSVLFSDIDGSSGTTVIDGSVIKSGSITLRGLYDDKTETDGYVFVDDMGLGLFTDSGEIPIMRLSYWSSNYDYPYISMGRGVDDRQSNAGMIKKFQHGIWIGNNSDMETSSITSGTGLFINFTEQEVYKYVNGQQSPIGGAAVFG